MDNGFDTRIRKFVDQNIPAVSHGMSVSVDRGHENIISYTNGAIPELNFKYTDE